jgi:pyruvate dehydrogenase E2 component (dihydrolipoamide acetyltransferase)
MADFILPELGENVTAGDVLRVLVKPGDTLAKDQTVLELETDKATIEVPSTVAGRVTTVTVKAGDKIKVGQLVLTVEGGAGAATSAAPKAPDRPVEPEDVAAKPSSPVAASNVVAISRGSRATPESARSDVPAAPAAPSVRRMARELGIDVDEVAGSGPGGRISSEDIKAHAKRLIEAAPGGEAGQIGATPLPDFSRWGDVDRRPMHAVRRKTAEHLSAA